MREKLVFINLYLMILVECWLFTALICDIYIYFIALRYVVSICMLPLITYDILSIKKHPKCSVIFTLINSGIVYLFNPISPIHLERVWWILIDLAIMGYLVFIYMSFTQWNYNDESRNTLRHTQTKD